MSQFKKHASNETVQLPGEHRNTTIIPGHQTLGMLEQVDSDVYEFTIVVIDCDHKRDEIVLILTTPQVKAYSGMFNSVLQVVSK